MARRSVSAVLASMLLRSQRQKGNHQHQANDNCQHIPVEQAGLRAAQILGGLLT